MIISTLYISSQTQSQEFFHVNKKSTFSFLFIILNKEISFNSQKRKNKTLQKVFYFNFFPHYFPHVNVCKPSSLIFNIFSHRERIVSEMKVHVFWHVNTMSSPFSQFLRKMKGWGNLVFQFSCKKNKGKKQQISTKKSLLHEKEGSKETLITVDKTWKKYLLFVFLFIVNNLQWD